MSQTCFPEGYEPQGGLSLFETQAAISFVKDTFEKHLCDALSLTRVSAPLFVECNTGLNDDLNGVERAVRFDIRAAGKDAEVVHSLAKWKREALWRYGFPVGQGLYTDMNAIRRDEDLDNLHSVYVDQWDWEKILPENARTEEYLEKTVSLICEAVYQTHLALKARHPEIPTQLNREVTFVTSEELCRRYPNLTPKERENSVCREHKTVFIRGIGHVLSDGKPHDGRAPDYDDWNLNGDLLYWFEPLQCALEISSMGIRVNADSMRAQLVLADREDRAELPFHTRVLDGTLPDTMGGGIGQSRLCMLLMNKAHVGEVQSSVWDDGTIAAANAAGVTLL